MEKQPDAPEGGIRLRFINAEVVTGSDAATLKTALNEFFENAGEGVLVKLQYIADYEVLILYSE